MQKHANLLGQFSPEFHFSKMIHTGKKSISLSLNEPTLPALTRKLWGRESGACTPGVHSQTHTRTHGQAANAADASLTVELGHAHKSPEHRHAYKHAQL